MSPILQEGKLRLGQGDFPHSLSQILNGNVSPFGTDLRTHGFRYEAMPPGSFRWPQLRRCTQRDRGGWDWGCCLSKTLGTSTHLTDMSIRDLLQAGLGWAPPDLISSLLFLSFSCKKICNLFSILFSPKLTFFNLLIENSLSLKH